MYRAAALMFASWLVAATAAADERLPPRDPMRPFGAGPAAALGVPAGPRWHLTAVLISSARRIAIVNGAPYGLGETVDGAEIVRIEADAVHLRRRGRELVIPLGRLIAVDQSTDSEGEIAP